MRVIQGKKHQFVLASATDITKTEVQSDRKTQSQLATDYIPFTQDTDNLLPNKLAQRARRSSLHHAILQTKKQYTIGDGVDPESTTLDIAKINSDGESLDSVLKKASEDWWLTGNYTLQIVEVGNQISLFHQDITTFRVSRDGENALLNRNWPEYNSNKNKTTEIPLFPQFGRIEGKTGKYSIFHAKDYNPEFYYYGLPDYIGALKWVDIEHKIPKYNVARFDNGFMPSVLISLVDDNIDEEEGKELVENVEKKFTGEGNNAKVWTQIVANKENIADIKIIEDKSDGVFKELQKLTSENLIYAHRWHPALVMNMPGKLSNSSDIMTAHEMVMNTVISPFQKELMDHIGKIYNVEPPKILNSTPVSFKGQVNVNEVLTETEKRALLGYAPREEGNG